MGKLEWSKLENKLSNKSKMESICGSLYQSEPEVNEGEEAPAEAVLSSNEVSLNNVE